MTKIFVDLYAESGSDFSSESVDIVGYDRDSKTLYVEFLSGAAVYSYEGVEESTYNLFVNADSVGGFFAKHIKDKGYPGTKSPDDVITLREDEPLVPTGDPWGVASAPQATVNSGLTITSADKDIIINIPSARINMPKAKFGIRWTLVGTTISSEPIYEATDAGAALRDFQKDFATFLGDDIEAKITAVVHYFE